MFAGLPGIGVGTLFYVLTALWMPVKELGRVLRGDFSAARWRLVITQLCFALSIIASIAIADRVLAIALADRSVSNINPARIVNDTFAAQAPTSFWAAPVAASLLLLVAVLLFTEFLRWVSVLMNRTPAQQQPDATEAA
jgi:flagellar biosynthesis protein FlhB